MQQDIVNSNMEVLYSNRKQYTNGYLKYRSEWQNRPINKQPGNFPLFLDLDISTVCNFSCPTCSCTLNKSELHFMDLDLYKRIIDEAAENECYGAKFHTICRGEPLLHPDIVEMVEYAKKAGMIDVRMNTNGSLLNRSLIRSLVKAKLDMLIVSMDGSTKEEYKKSGRSGNFNEIVMMINVFRQTIKDICGNWHKPILRVQTIKLPHINIKQYMQYWRLYADEVTVIDYQDMKKRQKGLKTNDWYCPMSFQRMSILWDGTILPCNMDDRKLLNLGKINSKYSIDTAWNSMIMDRIRRYNIEFKAEKLSLCDGCYLRTNEILKRGVN